MSRIGKKIITVPEEVGVEISGNRAIFSGKKGMLALDLPRELSIRESDGKLSVDRKKETKSAKSLHGLYHRLVENAIRGVSEGWQKRMELVGTGYRAKLDGKNLVLSVGFSHPVVLAPPEGIDFSVEENKINVSGVDKALVGQICASIRKIRPPEPYKGKGIKYVGEKVRRKSGKAKATTAQ